MSRTTNFLLNLKFSLQLKIVIHRLTFRNWSLITYR